MGLEVVQLQPEVAMGDGQDAGRQLLPRRGVVQLFGGEECGSLAETGLRAGAVGARAQEVLPGFETPDPKIFAGAYTFRAKNRPILTKQ
jgi:hypothetical protein